MEAAIRGRAIATTALSQDKPPNSQMQNPNYSVLLMEAFSIDWLELAATSSSLQTRSQDIEKHLKEKQRIE